MWPHFSFLATREVALILERRQLLGAWRRAGLQVSSLTLRDTHPGMPHPHDYRDELSLERSPVFRQARKKRSWERNRV